MLSNYPGYQRFFSRAARIFGVLAEGRHIFDRRPKPRAAKPGHYKDLTKTGNRDRKVSGTQGTVKPKYWANLFKYIFFCFVLLFTSSSPYRKDQFAVLWFPTSYYCIDPSLRSKRFPAVCPLPSPPREQRRRNESLGTARKKAQVKGLLFHFSRGQNRESCSSVFLCSETKRKRLLRRLYWSRSTTEDTVAVNGLSLWTSWHFA